MASDAPAQERGAEPLEGFWERARRLIHHDPARAHPGTSKQTQQELARLINLRVDAEVYGASTPLLGAIDLAIGALEKEPPELEVAKAIRKHAEDTVYFLPTTRRVLLGALLSMVLPLIISVILVIGDFGHRGLNFLGFDVWILWWIALSGSLGAIISMLLRIPDFIHLNKLEASTQLYAGLFRPIIGGSFALLVYFIVYSEVLGVGLKIPAGPGANAFFLAASFVAGFSERLAPTIAAKTEEVIVGRQQVPG